MIRLAQITPHLSSGGVEQRIARVIAGLDRNAYELSWVGLGEANASLVARAGKNVEVFSRPKAKEEGIDTGLILRIARVLRERRIEIAHVHNWSTSVYAITAARLAGVKKIIYGVGGREQPEGASAKQRAVMRVLAPHVDHYTTVCDFLAREMAVEWGVSPQRISTVRTGIELARFEGAASRAKARRRLGIPDDAILFGALTVLRPVKRVEDLIAAAGRASRRFPQIHVALIGNIFDDSEQTIRRWAQEAGLGERIVIPGRIEDPENVLPGFDVYVNCSVFEGTSNAIMEAMASGLPIVATRVGGTPELVCEDENALLVEARDVEALGAAFEKLAGDPQRRQRFGVHARGWVAERHGLQQMADASDDLYRRVADAPERSLARRGARSMAGLLAGLAILSAEKL